MAKFVIVGKSDCPYFAKAELVADELSRNLPDFRVHKIVIDPCDWESWLENVCAQNGWTHTKSPIVWRELVTRGGKGMLLGDAHAFQQYAKDYYGIINGLTSEDLNKISAENEKTFRVIQEEKKKLAESIVPFNVTITNPNSNVLYFIVNEILNGSVFGAECDINIRLYSPVGENDASGSRLVLEGIKMEIEDLASDKLRSLKIVTKPDQAFSDTDFVIVFDELLQNEDENEDEMHHSYVTLAKDIDRLAKTTCKVLISPFDSRSQTYALCSLFSKHMKRINAKTQLMGNSMCETMLVKAVLADRLKVNQSFLKNVNVIGQSLGDSFFIDMSYGRVTNYDGAVWARTASHWLNLLNMIADKDWVKTEFVQKVQQRDEEVGGKLKRSAILMFAQSVVILAKKWCNKDPAAGDDALHSAIVNPIGHYSIKENVFISMPVKFDQGQFAFVKNYKFSPEARAILDDIIEDTHRSVETAYKEEGKYLKSAKNWKLKIANVLFEQ